MEQYNNELKNIDFNRKFNYEEEISLEGFRELLQRLLEIKKKDNLDVNRIENMSNVMEIAAIEMSLQYIEDYIQGDLTKKYEFYKEFVVK